MDEGRLGGAVGERKRHAQMTRAGGDVDDAAPPARRNAGTGIFAHHEGAGEIDRNGLVQSSSESVSTVPSA